MRIVALMENTSGKKCCRAEHGLSLYIETDRHKVLFDAGASGLFAKNALALGVDLAAVDTAVLSHGHSDHSGGMTTFFRLNDHAKLYARATYDRPRYNRDGKYIGVEPRLIGHPRIVAVGEDRLRLDNELTIASYAGKPCEWPVDTCGMMMEAGGVLVPEQFGHEQYLLVSEGAKKVLISGCSHRGILNIMEWASKEGAQAVVGGFHFKDVPEDQFRRMDAAAAELKRWPVTYYTCHCTGVSQYDYLRQKMGEQLRYLATGDELAL